jgi:hypothetical protein
MEHEEDTQFGYSSGIPSVRKYLRQMVILITGPLLKDLEVASDLHRTVTLADGFGVQDFAGKTDFKHHVDRKHCRACDLIGISRSSGNAHSRHRKSRHLLG